MYTVTIKYTAPVEAAGQLKSTIAPQFALGQSYVDEEAFRKDIPESAYSKNVWENGHFIMAESLEEYFATFIAHPGLVAALKKAMRDGTYKIEEVSEKDGLYMDEVKDALASQGFEIKVVKAEGAVAEG